MVLELIDIYKSFGEKSVLKGISFKAESGKAFGLLGRNGAGKTTTIRILMDVFPATSGKVFIDGKPIDYKNVSIGYLPEERGLYPKKIIFDQLLYFAELKGMDVASAKKSIDYWLNRLEMSEYKTRRLDTLSKGNQQKIQLITALINDPDIVILDEPFSGLDPVNALMLKEVVQEQIQKNKIVLFSSHQMSYIEEFCDSIAIISGGVVTISGDLYQIKRNYPRDKLVVESRQVLDIAQKYGSRCEIVNETSLIFKLDSPEDKAEVIASLANGFDIDSVKVYEPSLNDIFVQYAGDI